MWTPMSAAPPRTATAPKDSLNSPLRVTEGILIKSKRLRPSNAAWGCGLKRRRGVTAGRIDLDHLEKYVSGDAALRDEILVIFAEQLSRNMGELDLDASDNEWRAVSHRLKGAARGVGAWRLGALAEESETLVDGVGGKCEQRAALLLSMRLEAERIDAHIRELRGLSSELAVPA